MHEPRTFPSRVLVLGATSAIAIAVMRKIAGPGVQFYLVGRNDSRLATIAQDLVTRGSESIETRSADLDDTASHPVILSDALSSLGWIDMALIAYGVLGDQEQAERDYRAAEAVLRTNFLSAVSLITWLANYFEAHRTGTLAVITSVAGDRGRKSNYVYGASKGALNIFLDGVRNRIDRNGVHVLTIRPGFVDTPMTAHLPKSPLFASPEKIADGIIHAVRRRKDVAYVPGFWAFIMFLIRAIPNRVFKKMNI